MNCKDVEYYLPLYPDEVPISIRESLDVHLQQCQECRALLNSLNVYKSYVANPDRPKVPGDLETQVMDRIESQKISTRNRNFLLTFGLVTASVAALVLLFFVIKHLQPPWKAAPEIHFAMRMEKIGKGPSPLVNVSGLTNSFHSVLSASGAVIRETGLNSTTGCYDYVIVGISTSNLSQFVEKFNALSAQPAGLPTHPRITGDIIYIKVWFDMIRFMTGNFDGDHRDDLIIQFVSGKNKGKWFLYSNNDSGYFTTSQPVKISPDESQLLGDGWLLSGDFNGDGLDDLCLYEYNEKQGLSTHFLENIEAYTFREISLPSTNLSFPGKGEFVILVSGDATGHGKDDLWRIARIDSGLYLITDLSQGKSFEPLRLPDMDSGRPVIIAGDFNGDHYSDICVKYLAIYKRENTDIYLNRHDFSFGKSLSGGLSYQGDYIIWADDYNGDGYDDLFVKSGGYFLPGNWSVMQNNQSGRFKYATGFELLYPEDNK